MSSSYQVVLWKQESFVVLRPLQIEFFRNLLGRFAVSDDAYGSPPELLRKASRRLAMADLFLLC
jgi:hypothetical protein